MLESLVKKVRRIWDGDTDTLPMLQLILRVLAQLYTVYMRLRADFYHRGICRRRTLSCRVISVGNLSVGGTGKTPLVLYLASLLTAAGKKVVVVSRGYRGRFEKTGGIVSDGQQVLAGAFDSGDEPQILARQLAGVPVVVDGNRYRAGQRACAAFAPDVILLDDAFQHLKLQRDLDLVLVDGRRPLGNGRSLPAGELREPAAALRRAHAVIMTRCPDDARSPEIIAGRNELRRQTPEPIFHSRHIPVVRKVIAGDGNAHDSDPLAGRRVFAFSGLAKNDEFLYTLSRFGCEVVGSLGFPDHHFYSERDLVRICRRASGLDVDTIVTTEKDYVKIKPGFKWTFKLVVFGVEISFGKDKERFHAFIEKRMNDFRGYLKNRILVPRKQRAGSATSQGGRED